jgi:hypothetical protein
MRGQVLPRSAVERPDTRSHLLNGGSSTSLANDGGEASTCKREPRAAPSRGQVRFAMDCQIVSTHGRAGRALSCLVQSLTAAASWPVRTASSTAKRAR